MATDEQVSLVDQCLFATHKVPCALRGCPSSAVLELDKGIYQPCWKCQEKYKVINVSALKTAVILLSIVDTVLMLFLGILIGWFI